VSSSSAFGLLHPLVRSGWEVQQLLGEGLREELEDLAAYDRVKKEKGSPLSWEKVKR